MSWLTNIPVSTRDKERTLEAKRLQEEHVKQIALREEAKIARVEQKVEPPKSLSTSRPNYALEIALFGAPMGLFKR